ncbi:MAG: alkaline phosphatase family protein, partial [Anaerolineales bacterium]
AFLHYSISGSGLSRMHYRDVQLHTFGGIPDLWIGVRRLADQPIRKKRYIWVYYGGVDGLSHRHGPDSEQAQADFASFTSSMMEDFVRQVSPEAGAKTLLLLFADHGQITTHKDPHFELRNHPDLTQRFHILPTGENRLAYLYLRPGHDEAVNEYIKNTWPGSFTTIPSDHALKAGLFGPGLPARLSPDRLGDLTVLTHGDSYLWWADKENPLIGRHGGLSSEEMLVPLLAARLS